MTRCAATFVLGLTLLLSAHTAQASEQLSSAEKARKFLEAKGGERLAAEMIDTIVASVHDVPPEVWASIRKQVRPGELIDLLVPVYRRHLSDADLDALLGFYTSAAGKRYTEAETVILKEALQTEQQWALNIVRQAVADIETAKKAGGQPAPAPAVVAPPSAAASPSTAKARKFLQASGTDREAAQLADIMVEQLRQSHPDVRSDFWPALRQRIHPDELIDLLAPFYQRHLSNDDLDALTRFFTSPPGVHFIQAQPAIVRESMQIGQEWAGKLIEPALADLLEKQKQADAHSAEAGGSIRVAAEAGDPKAQTALGEAYEWGKHGVAKNHAEAAKWYRKAADQNYMPAEMRLARLYVRSGDGLTADPAEAAKWYRKAAEQGDRGAQHELAFLYAIGEGVPRDAAEAAKWNRKAAERGDVEAQVELANAYLRGDGVTRDSAEAMKWYRKAAEAGNKEAAEKLAEIRAGNDTQPGDVPAGTTDPTQPLLQSTGGKGRFTGEPIDLRLRQAGLRGVFYMFAELTGLNLVLDSRVQTRVTGDFNGPWDEVLDTIVEKNNLIYKIQGVTLVVGPKDSPLMDADLLKGLSDKDPISLTVIRAGLQDIIKTFARIGVNIDNQDAQRAGSVTAFVVDVPSRQVLRMVLAAAGYTSTEHDGAITIQTLPGADRFTASAQTESPRCLTDACDDIGFAKLRGTMTPQKKGASSVALFEFTTDRYTVSKSGAKLGINGRVADTAPAKVSVTDLRTDARGPLTFFIDKLPTQQKR